MEQGHTDTDMGLNSIFNEIEKLKTMCVKVGVIEDVGSQTVDGVTVAQYAGWNELGVLGPPVSQNGDGKWFIPPRPFIRGFADGKREQIKKYLDRLGKNVFDGKIKAEEAMKRLGEYGQSGVKSYIRNGEFTPNADVTIVRKGSTKPLIDTETLRNSIRYQILNQPVGTIASE